MGAVLDFGHGQEKTKPQKENIKSLYADAQDQSHIPDIPGEGFCKNKKSGSPQASLPQHSVD
jgi:hypothetical protein